jgi:hypothetical protein
MQYKLFYISNFCDQNVEDILHNISIFQFSLEQPPFVEYYSEVDYLVIFMILSSYFSGLRIMVHKQ